jgi:glucose/arabinose dehydrogenase
MLVGGLSSQALIRLVLDGERVALEERIDMQQRVRDVVQAPDGAILVIVDDQNGDLLRLTPAA